MEPVKNGECYFRDEAGLWLAESFVTEGGATTTRVTLIEPAE